VVRARDWIKNAKPDAGPGCALYLPLVPAHAAPLDLISRSPHLQELAITRGGVKEYAIASATTFHMHRRKARAQYNRSLCVALFSKESAFCIAYNVMDGFEGPMKLSPQTLHLDTLENLMHLICSDKLYTDPHVHKLWVGAHASGQVYGSERQLPSRRLDEFLSVNYDAHGRLECGQRLRFQGFRHGCTPAYLAQQAATFRGIRKLTRADRLSNLTKVTLSNCKPPFPNKL
jgi:hypothetical protein